MDADIEKIIRLSAPEKYNYFIKKVSENRCAWGLYDDGWAMSESDGGDQIFPIWPEEEYANMCISGQWSGYSPERIEIDELLSELIPALKNRDVLPGVFFTHDGASVDVSIDLLERELQKALLRGKSMQKGINKYTRLLAREEQYLEYKKYNCIKECAEKKIR